MVDKFCIPTLFVDHSLIISSHEIGYAKPDKEIYEIAFKRAQALLHDIKPGEILFMDDKENNVAAAKNCGFHAFVWDARISSYGTLVKHLISYGIDEAVEI